jgi:hypothetical protein
MDAVFKMQSVWGTLCVAQMLKMVEDQLPGTRNKQGLLLVCFDHAISAMSG